MISVAISDQLLPRSEVYRSMGYGDVTPDADVCNLVDRLCQQALAAANPSFHYELFRCEVKQDSIVVGDVDFDLGRTIATLLRRSESAVLFVATAGDGFQHWLDKVSESGDILEMFVADAIGSTLVEAVGDQMESVLEGEIGSLKHTNVLARVTVVGILCNSRFCSFNSGRVCGVDLLPIH